MLLTVSLNQTESDLMGKWRELDSVCRGFVMVVKKGTGSIHLQVRSARSNLKMELCTSSAESARGKIKIPPHPYEVEPVRHVRSGSRLLLALHSLCLVNSLVGLIGENGRAKRTDGD